jgi:proteasome lid subunit RPN8/RPN11
MGVTQSKPKDAPPVEPTSEVSEPARDANRIPAGQWLRRAVPRGVSGRTAGFQVVFASKVIDDIRSHGLSSPDAEVCGVLVGNVYGDDRGPWCRVSANIRGNGAAGRNAQVTFTTETWAHINHAMDTKYREERIVGWYHTHPGFGIFLSEMDVFIHENFFGEPWQIAYVDDPKEDDRGTFVWEKDSAVRRAHLVEPPPPGAAAAAAGAIDELASAARTRLAGHQRATGRRRLVRAAVLASALLAVLALGALTYSGIIPRQRLTRLAPIHWLSEKIMGHSTFSR